jgi:hypothetical protein
MLLEQPPASVPDFAALRACWHPVGYARALTDAPLRVRDLCIHRGTACSLGNETAHPRHASRSTWRRRCT